MLRRVGLLALVVVLAGATTPASPVQLSYTYSDSMAPTIEAGDGYVLVPAGDVEPGEVVTFRSPTRDRYVTHRVVRETERGFVTKGDANPDTDQAAGYPPVPRSAVVGEVLTVGGRPVVVPGVGRVVRQVGAHRPALLALALALALLDWRGLRGAAGRATGDDVLRVGDVVGPALAAGVVVSALLLVLTASHASTTYVVTESGSGPRALAAGETAAERRRVVVDRAVVTYAVVGTEGMTLRRPGVGSDRVLVVGHDGGGGTLFRQSTETVPVAIDAGPPGRRTTELHVYTYPRLLPAWLLARLHAVHPLVAAAASAAVGFAPLAAAYALFVDGSRPLRLPRRRFLRAALGGD